MKIVLTGGPCCGKTTVINELHRRGYNIIPECAREILELRSDKKVNKKELHIRQYLMMDTQKQREKTQKDVFMDRSLIDIMAYSKYYGVKIKEFKNNYDYVFVLDQLEFINDGTRIEKNNEGKKLHKFIIKEYIANGYNPIFVPVLPLKDRVDFIISNI